MAAYEHAVQRLYQASLADFIAVRKRLAAELRAEGAEAEAVEIGKRLKPPTAVWAVNQLYWQARDLFDDMLTAAARLRAGDRGTAKAHRDAISALRGRAARILEDAGYGASDATLRRIQTTLSAIAAAGGFAPDPPGALSADRDPPGFDLSVSLPVQPMKPRPALSASGTRQSTRAADSARDHGKAAAQRKAREAEREQRDGVHARLEAERQRREEERERHKAERELHKERERRKAERTRLQTGLRAAAADLRIRERTRVAAERSLRDADKALKDARDAVQDLEHRLAELSDKD